MKLQDLQETWKQYLAAKAAGFRDRKIENCLIEHYYPLLKIVATKMHPKHHQFTIDELISMGVGGLYDAISKFDEERNVKFETYAMPRIKGSVLDEIRKNDWVPRLVRSNNTKLDKARNIHESCAGRHLSDAEMAEAMKISLDDFNNLVRGSATPAIHSMNDVQTENDQVKTLSIDHIEDRKSSMPGEKMLRKELFDKLMGKNFTPQERKIIWLYYLEETTMKEISHIVDLSESRVSQMHADILERLRQKAKRNPEYFSDINEFVGQFKETVVC